MSTLVIKSNPARATDVLIEDLGIIVVSGGGSVTLTELDEIEQAAESDRVLALATDNAHGAGSSTLILNDGTVDIAQANASNFLRSVRFPRTGPFSMPVRDKDGNETVVGAGSGRAFFGDGSDGVVTLVANTTITRDMFYSSLTTGAFFLNTNGFRVFVRNTLTIASGGGVRNNGASATDASGAAGTNSNGSIGFGGAGGNNKLDSIAVSDSLGGQGGAGGSPSGGNGGTVTAPGVRVGSARGAVGTQLGASFGAGSNQPVLMQGGSGGGGGGGTGPNTGGGGGGGGGIVVLGARVVVNNGAIRAHGGDGAPGQSGSGGGGGGGGGGVIMMLTDDYSGSGTRTVSGGAGGAGIGTGGAGAAGAAGTLILLGNG